MQRFRITTQPRGGTEQAWVLLPDLASATMQARELSQRERALHVRVYEEGAGEERELIEEFSPRE